MGEDIAVANFREYLRIKSVHPKPDYEGCVKFLFRLADELGIQRRKFEVPVQGQPHVVLTVKGTHPELPALLLYSHMDVVPVFEEHWKHEPFSAVKEDNGNIYARGSQDMKCVGIQYLEAIRRHFERRTRQFLRTVHMIYGSDEERGGYNGMRVFTESQDFKDLNIGWVLDEGLASPTETFQVYYGERNPWWAKVTFPGNPGHAMEFIENTAMEKMHRFMNSALAFRAKWKKILNDDPTLRLGDVPTLNIPIIQGGVQANVIPDKFVLDFIIRVPPNMDFDALKAEVDGWLEEAGKDVTVEWVGRQCVSNTTKTTSDDPLWNAFESTLTSLGCKLNLAIFPGATDSRYMRPKGYSSIGFSPMNHTPVLLHDHNEFLNEKIYLRGVDIYEKLIENIANIKP